MLKVCGTLMRQSYCPPAGVLFPCGHIISDVVPIHVKHLYSIPSISKFKSDLDFLCRQYRPLELSELERITEFHDRRVPARQFLLSFDDGMREVYDVVAPILRSKGVPAIFFLNTAMIDNRRLMWRHKISLLIERARATRRIPTQLKAHSVKDLVSRLKAATFDGEGILDEVARFYELDFDEYLQRLKPYLTTSQILDLARQGFEFGAHGASHGCLGEMAVQDQREQVTESVQWIRALGIPCRFFAYPFHDNGVPTSVFQHIADLGLILSFGTSEARLDSIPFSFQRFSLDGGNANSSVQDVLRQLSVKSAFRRLSRTDVIHRQ